jgi:hypothetical protein
MSTFPELCDNQLDVVRSEGHKFQHDNLPEFLQNQSKMPRTNGFLDQPAVTLRVSQNALPKDKCAQVFRYVKALQNQEETNFVRIRLGRALLYLCYIEELEETKRKRRRGIKGTGKVETEAINSLLEETYAAEGRGGPIDDKKRKKIRKSYLEEKRHGERWWWLAYFAGPGVLVACSRETGYKVYVPLDGPKFPLH